VAAPGHPQRPAQNHRSPPPARPSATQSPAFEPSANGGDRRDSTLSETALELVAQLARAPGRMALPPPSQPSPPKDSGPARRALRTARSIFESTQPLLLITVSPLIRGLTRNSKPLAKLGHRKPACDHLPHQIKPLLLSVCYFPRHAPWKMSAMS
jgi:hypothetical protein